MIRNYTNKSWIFTGILAIPLMYIILPEVANAVKQDKKECQPNMMNLLRTKSLLLACTFYA